MPSETDVTIGQVVREIRRRLNLRQDELADLAGLGHKQTVSEIERGRRSLKAAELARLANVLHVDANELLMGVAPPAGPFVLWRGDAGVRNRADAEALLRQRCRRYSFLERLAGEPGGPSLPQYQLDIDETTYEGAEALADEVRTTLQLGDAPGAGLRKNLENHWRIKIIEDLLEEGSGATTHGEYGPAILENATEPPSRRSFSLAHELFHLLTWDAIAARIPTSAAKTVSRNEQLADCFARSLLMPRDAIERRLSGRSIQRLFDLLPVAHYFSASLTALLWRLVNMDRLDRSLVQEFLSRPWGATDSDWEPPEHLDKPLPERYVNLAFTVYMRGEISIGKLAELLETTVGMVEYRLSRYGFDLNSDEYQTEILPA